MVLDPANGLAGTGKACSMPSSQAGSSSRLQIEHLYEEHANMSFIPSDQPLRWFVGKQYMISRKQMSVSAKSPTHSSTNEIKASCRKAGFASMWTGFVNTHYKRRPLLE